MPPKSEPLVVQKGFDGVVIGERITELDGDFRRDPKTKRFCCACQRDIKPQAKARQVWLIGGGFWILHPDDWVSRQTRAEGGVHDPWDVGLHLLGQNCARKMGLKWSKPEPRGT